MKIHTEFRQNTPEWLAARAGVVTASEADNLISPLYAVRKGKGVESYLSKKLAEKWTGQTSDNIITLEMEFGHILEEEALPWIEFELGAVVDRPAFITDLDGTIGCSPDGVIGGNIGLEIKCPKPPNHVKYLRAGQMPEDYVAQVQFSMFVTGFQEWRFVSYSRRFPKLILTTERDEKAMSAIKEALESFLDEMKRGYAQLVDLNGGNEPKRYNPPPHAPVDAPAAQDRFDILN